MGVLVGNIFSHLTGMILLALVSLQGCGNYYITLNEQLVYEPAKLFRDYDIADAALSACIEQRIADEFITQASDLTQLNCSNAGIEKLDGLALFTNLQELKLSENRIRNLVELGQLKQLEQLWLDANQVVDPVPLTELQLLETLDLSGNSRLQCPSESIFSRVPSLSLPEHCKTL